MKPTDSLKEERKALRARLREQRRNLSAEAQHEAAIGVAEIAFSQQAFALGAHCALYMDADGEVATQPLLEALWAHHVACYLPVLIKETMTLCFRQHLPGCPLHTNYFGLLEPPADAREIAPAELSTVFMPLVGFDDQGNRLGMGGGFYDRTFAFLPRGEASTPVLVGLAHECQRVEGLETATWDVPLKGVITGKQLILAG